METVLEQHQVEIEQNRLFWHEKPILQKIYAGFYERIAALVNRRVPGRIVELGSGIGQLKSHFPDVISTDLFPNRWLDAVCDGYELPFRSGSLSHLILFDVFHHLEAPKAFFKEARRVLGPGGRMILFEPYISWCSFPIYGLLHHEPVAWRAPIKRNAELPRPRAYYAAQGNATRIFFNRRHRDLLDGWTVLSAEALASFAYFLSGGFSKPAMYSDSALPALRHLDDTLSRWPSCFGGRCLVALEPAR